MNERINKFERAKNRIPNIIGKMAQSHFKASFKNQGFTDQSLEKWQNVERRRPGTRAYKQATNADRTRAILVGSPTKNPGVRLKDSIRIMRADWNVVVIATDVKYAETHNDGVWTSPKRQFMGESEVLNNRIKNDIKDIIEDIFK